MIRSLALKLGMLAVTIGVICWMRWQIPDGSEPEVAPEDNLRTVSVGASTEVGAGPSGFAPVEARTGTAETHVLHESRAGGRLASQERAVLPERVDLNRADAKALESLPGIGAVLAQRVIAYRTSVGRFQTIEDLRAVKGIGPKTIERLRPLVIVAEEGVRDAVEKRPL